MLKDVNENERDAIEGGQMCTWFWGPPLPGAPPTTWVDDGDWCIGIRW